MALQNLDGLRRLAIVALAATTVPLTAEVSIDGSMTPGNLKPPVPLNGKNYQIAHTLGTTAGKNLFHSFDRFSLDSGYSATFTGPAGLKNVIARVTGGQASNIQGSIISEIEGADLYLINPSGIMFGEGASVDVKGSFTATTADYLSLRDRKTGAELGRFWASLDAATTLSCAAPSAFGFLGSVPPGGSNGTVTISGAELIPVPEAGEKLLPEFRVAATQIEVTDTRNFDFDDTDLKFVALELGEARIGEHHFELSEDAQGGKISIKSSRLRAFGTGSLSLVTAGSIEASDSAFRIETSESPLAPEVVRTSSSGEPWLEDGKAALLFHAGDDITISGGSDLRLDLYGTGEDSGMVLVAGGNLALLGNSDMTLNAVGDHSTGSTLLSAGGDLTLTGNSEVNQVITGDHASGAMVLLAGGDLAFLPDANTPSVASQAAVSQSLDGAGSSGGMLLASEGDMILTGFAEIFHSNTSTGTAPAPSAQPSASPADVPENGITLRTGGQLAITDFARIYAEASGSARGGDIDVSANSLMIHGPDRADTPAERARSTGLETVTQTGAQGGDIRVNVEQSIGIYQAGGIYASTNGPGTSGSILVEGRDLEIVGARNYDRARWGVTTPKNFFITGISNKGARDSDVGNLGSITVRGFESIRLTNGGLIDATNFATGSNPRSGDVSVEAGSIQADRGDSDYFTGIGAGTEASGTSDDSVGADGGNVTVRSPKITLLNGAQIAASSRSGGDAGTVRVFTDHLLAIGRNTETPFLFTGESGLLAATRSDGAGGAGDVIVKPLGRQQVPLIQLQDGAEIGARAEGSGAGGSVQVGFSGGRVELDSEASISARSGEFGGTAGSVVVAGKIILRNGSSISSTNAADPKTGGDAGSVVLYPESLIVDHSRLEVSATGGDAGEIRIEGGLLLDIRNSAIDAEAFEDGGNIVIKGARAVLLDGSSVSANAINGDGGNIEIQAPAILSDQSTVTASSQLGVDGVVRIEPQAVLSGAEGELEASPLDVTDSLQPECTDWADTKAGSFIRAGRGGSARLPGGYLPSLRLYGAATD
jgi:filamentous hemagglutinin family protein